MGLMKSVGRISWISIFCYLFLIIEKVKGKLKAEIRLDSKHNVTRIDMDKEASIHLFRQWQDQAVSGLMAAIASKKFVF